MKEQLEYFEIRATVTAPNGDVQSFLGPKNEEGQYDPDDAMAQAEEFVKMWQLNITPMWALYAIVQTEKGSEARHIADLRSFEAAMALEDLLLQPLMYIRDKLGDVNWPGSVNHHVMGILSKCEDIIIQSSNEDRL